MHIIVFLRNWMRPNHYFYSISFLDEITKIGYAGTRRVSDNQPGSQVNNLCSVLNHFLGSIFNVSPRAAITSSISNQFQFIILIVNAKRSFPVTERSKAFTSGTGMVTVTDNNSNFNFIFHYYFLLLD